MEVVNGVVEFISSKPAGRGTAHNIKVGGDWYGYGFNAPSFSKGDNIKFTWTANGNFKNVDVASVEVLSAVVEAATPKGKATDWDAKDKRIAYMSARNTACAVVKAAIDIGAFKLPTKAADKYGAFVDAVEEQAQEYFHSLYDSQTFANPTFTEQQPRAVGEE